MDLSKIISPKETRQELYWSLVIEPGWVQASIWKIEGEEKRATVVVIGSSTRWETPEDLVNAADTSLSSAIQRYPQDLVEPSKTVFGVSPTWVTEGQIKKDHLDKIRTICIKLSLEPAGFVVLPEAIAYLIKSEEGSALNGVVIGMGIESIEVTVFNLGNLSGTATVAKSLSIVDDVVEGLSRFSLGDPLPSRFLIYDGKEGELEEARQALVTTDWQEAFAGKVRVLHVPKVEIVSPDRKMIAVSLAGAAEIAGVASITIGKEEAKAEELKADEEEELAEIDKQDREPDSSAFESDNLSPIEAGFAIDKDIPPPVIDEDDVEIEEAVPKAQPKVQANQPVSKILVKPPKLKIGSILSKVSSLVPKLSLPTSFGRPVAKIKRLASMGVAAALIFIIAGVAIWWFVPKATVTIYVEAHKIEAVRQVSFDVSGADTKLNDFIFKTKGVEAVVEGDKTQSTTGTKTVGEKAKGSVEIRNGGSVPLSLESGTLLASSSGLKFRIDSAVSVPEASSPSTPGSATVSVTADAIGSEYNLSKDETFKVSNYPKSDVDALASGDFSGGSSRQISAVSKDDRLNVEKDLTAELTQKGSDELAGAVEEGWMFVPQSVQVTALQTDFSNKEGDEAESLKLALKLSLKGFAVAINEVNEAAKSLLASQTPGEYILRDDQIDASFTLDPTKVVKGVVTANAKIAGNLIPKVDAQALRSAIVGKYPEIAQNYISSIPGYGRASIKVNPLFPGKLGTMPHVPENISIGIVATK